MKNTLLVNTSSLTTILFGGSIEDLKIFGENALLEMIFFALGERKSKRKQKNLEKKEKNTFPHWGGRILLKLLISLTVVDFFLIPSTFSGQK